MLILRSVEDFNEGTIFRFGVILLVKVSKSCLHFFRKVQHFEEKKSTPPQSSHSSRPLYSSMPSRNSSRSSITEFPSNSSDKIRTWSRSSRDTSNVLRDTENRTSVKRALIPHDNSLSECDASKIVEIQDSVLDDLSDTKQVLSQLQNMVCNVHDIIRLLLQHTQLIFSFCFCISAFVWLHTGGKVRDRVA